MTILRLRVAHLVAKMAKWAATILMGISKALLDGASALLDRANP